MDFNVTDSVRRDIKVLMTKTRYTVCDYYVNQSGHTRHKKEKALI